MRSSRTPFAALTLAVALLGGGLAALFLGGCGERKSFSVSSPSLADQHPLAVGTTWTVRIETVISEFPDTEKRECEQLETAVSTDPGVVRVESKGRCEVTLKGISAGDATIEYRINGRQGGFRVRAAALDRVNLGHTCTDATGAAYLAGREAVMQYRLVDSRGRAMFGDLFPVTFEPSSAVEVTAHDPGTGLAALKFADTTGKVSVRADVDGENLQINLIEVSDIDAIDTEFEGVSGDGAKAGRVYSFLAKPRADGAAVCQWDTAGLELEVSSIDPSVCTVEPAYGTVSSEWRVTMQSAGECQIFAGLGGGDGVESVESVVVE